MWYIRHSIRRSHSSLQVIGLNRTFVIFGILHTAAAFSCWQSNQRDILYQRVPESPQFDYPAAALQASPTFTLSSNTHNRSKRKISPRRTR
ncbi:hypothetical protein BDW71DRAFT_6694 [Aspergillus fruticulosus]